MNTTSFRSDEDFQKAQGPLLRATRIRSGKSLDEAAKWIGLTSQTLRKYERGESPTSTFASYSLAHLYGCELSDLIPSEETWQPTSWEQLRKRISAKVQEGGAREAVLELLSESAGLAVTAWFTYDWSTGLLHRQAEVVAPEYQDRRTAFDKILPVETYSVEREIKFTERAWRYPPERFEPSYVKFVTKGELSKVDLDSYTRHAKLLDTALSTMYCAVYNPDQVGLIRVFNRRDFPEVPLDDEQFRILNDMCQLVSKELTYECHQQRLACLKRVQQATSLGQLVRQFRSALVADGVRRETSSMSVGIIWKPTNKEPHLEFENNPPREMVNAVSSPAFWADLTFEQSKPLLKRFESSQLVAIPLKRRELVNISLERGSGKVTAQRNQDPPDGAVLIYFDQALAVRSYGELSEYPIDIAMEFDPNTTTMKSRLSWLETYCSVLGARIRRAIMT